jgi:hypothetical protein
MPSGSSLAATAGAVTSAKSLRYGCGEFAAAVHDGAAKAAGAGVSCAISPVSTETPTGAARQARLW